MNELKVGFSSLNDNALLDRANIVWQALTNPPGSVTFPQPTSPTTAELKTAITAFETCLASGPAISAATRDAARETLITGLQRLAAAIEIVANGDLAKLSESGFELKKKPVRSTGPTPIPENLRYKPTGTAGEALGKCQAVPNVDGYEAEYTLDPMAGPWTRYGTFSSSQKMLATGLQRGKDYYFRVRAFGPNGPSGWSDIATMMVV